MLAKNIAENIENLLDSKKSAIILYISKVESFLQLNAGKNKNTSNMTKEGLIEAIASKTSSKKEAAEIVNEIFDLITKALSKGEDVVITGFGTFSAKKRAARQGVNPKTGEKISIPAMTVPKFKAGKGLKEAVK